jgi:hypothetical protein
MDRNNSLKIVSLNCRGLKDFQKRNKIIQQLNTEAVDICFLQETHCSSLRYAHNWNKTWGGKLHWSFGSDRSKGVGIWFRPGLKFKIISTDRDNEGRLICVLVTINGQTVKLVNIYAPIIQRERKLFFESLKYFLQGKYPMILGGHLITIANNRFIDTTPDLFCMIHNHYTILRLNCLINVIYSSFEISLKVL